MKIIVFTLIVMSLIFGDAFAYTKGDFYKIPSNSYKKSFIETSIDPDERFERAETDPAEREILFSVAWLQATRSSPVDNRAYLFSLAVDLYNSLPPSAPYEFCGDCEAGDPQPGQEKAYYKPKTEMNAEERDSLLDYIQRHPSETWVVEKAYLGEFMTQNIGLDPFDAKPSMSASKIDLTNPTYYRPLQRWMAEQATAMAQGVPPWEAVTWTTEHWQEWGEGVTTSDFPSSETGQVGKGETIRFAGKEYKLPEEKLFDEAQAGVDEPSTRADKIETAPWWLTHFWRGRVAYGFLLFAILFSTLMWLLRRRKR